MNDRLVALVRKRTAAEQGVCKRDAGGRLRVALIYPNTYKVGMASLGFQHLYRLLNALPNVVCERAFLPDRPAEYERLDTELFTCETLTPVRDFHVVAFSCSYELDYFHLIRCLYLARISPLASDRGENDPLVLGGGLAFTFNLAPVMPFFDALFLGEVEPVVKELFQLLWRTREAAPEPKEDVLAALAALPGMLIPRFYSFERTSEGRLRRITAAGPARLPVKKVTADLQRLSPATSCLFAASTQFSKDLMVEIGRGCARGCKFCVSGHVCNPPRFHSASKVVQAALEATSLDFSRLLLVASALGDWPDLEAALAALVEAGKGVSVSSLRAERASETVLRLLKQGGARTVTIAPEAATERLRYLSGKPIPDEAFFDFAAKAQAVGLEKAKLYFLLGLPGETDADLEAFGDFVRRFKAKAPALGVRCAVGFFVPKPWTPYQWAPMLSLAELERRTRLTKAALSGIKGVSFTFASPSEALVQALLSRGDERLAPVLLVQAGKGLRLKTFSRALQEAGLDPEEYWRQRAEHEPFCWEIVDVGLARSTLWQRWQHTLKGSTDETS